MRWLKTGLLLGVGFGVGFWLAKGAVALSFYGAVALLIVVVGFMASIFLARNLVCLRAFLLLRRVKRERDQQPNRRTE